MPLPETAPEISSHKSHTEVFFPLHLFKIIPIILFLMIQPHLGKGNIFDLKKIPLTYFQAFYTQKISFIDFLRCLLPDTHFVYPSQNASSLGQNPPKTPDIYISASLFDSLFEKVLHFLTHLFPFIVTYFSFLFSFPATPDTSLLPLSATHLYHPKLLPAT